MTTLSDLSTPTLLLELSALRHNLEAMSQRLPGDRLRPHVKAHKSTGLAALQYAAGHTGFTCATPAEVIGLGRAGIGDELLLANETVDAGRLAAMAALDTPVIVAVDSSATAVAAANAGIKQVLIDVNVGLPRCGVVPDKAGALADECRALGLTVRGVMGYEGHLMMVLDRADQQRQVSDAMQLLVAAHADVGGDIVSAGGTGTHDLHEATGITEIQAGSYVLMDTEYAKHPFPFEQALFVLGTVIAVADGWAVLDVGLKAHAMDHGNPTVIGGETWFLSDEHLTFAPAQPVTVGDRVKVIPAHCDPTVAKHDRFVLVDGDEVVDELPIDLRGW